jgi:hypothetical protein
MKRNLSVPALLALLVGLASLPSSPLAAAGSTPAAPKTAVSSPPRPLPGDLPIERFPESDSLRAALYAQVLAGPRDSVLARRPSLLTNEYGGFRLSTSRSGDAFYLILAPSKGGDWPIYGQGSWIIKRDYADGRFIQAKVFLRSDPGCFVRIYPDGERSLLDVVLYGAVLNKEVPLPLSFDSLLALPFSTVVDLSRASVDWELFSPRPGDYAPLVDFAAAIRSRLPALRYVDDGGLDALARPVFIASGKAQGPKPGLNCSGFAQWVVDGLLSPLGLAFPSSAELKIKHPELRGASVDRALDDRYDPFFGLDWTRNLGLVAARALDPLHPHSLTEGDVRFSPFALFSSTTGAMNGGLPYEAYPAYDVDSGYPIKGLKALLYVLAIKEPGRAYLASLSRTDTTGLRRHYHVALLLPRFDKDGEFKVDLFESAAETRFDALLARAPRDFVHLVRLEPLPDFEPPALP